MARSIPSTRELIGGLVGLPSVSCANPDIDQSNRAVCEQMANWLQPLGFACELLPLPLQPEKCNLVATLPGQGDAPGLVLAGHTDTVPWDQDAWSSNPFEVVERDGLLHGLGVCDMKGFLALAVEVASEFAERPLAGSLTLLATADEETGMEGARMLVEQQRSWAGCAVIGEPTGLRPVRAHKGILMEAITLHGRAGHSSDPSLGANTIEAMAPVLRALREFGESLRREHSDPAFTVDHATLNPGHICGGDSPNRIPAHCELHVDLRFLPGMDLASLRKRLQQTVSDAIVGSGCSVSFRALFDGAPAYAIGPEAELVQTAQRLSGAEAVSVDFATEAAFFSQMNMQTIVLGPGDISVAHQPDESLALDRLEPMREILRGLIRQYCLGD